MLLKINVIVIDLFLSLFEFYRSIKVLLSIDKSTSMITELNS